MTSPPGDEFAFITALRALATHPGARGLNDDAAVLDIGGETLVISYDMLAEGVHVPPGMDAEDVAWRLVATALSDLAAKGAEPLGALLGFMLGPDSQNDTERFLRGLQAALEAYRAPLLGGDTVRGVAGAPRVFGLTVIGRARHRPVPARAGARPGEALWLAGSIGGAMLGYEALRAGSADAALTLAYRRPVARITEGIALAPHVSAMMDVSDGVLLDAARLARASGVRLAITADAVPLAAPEARRGEALRWGDDYALLFTAPSDAMLPVPAARIGTVAALSGEGEAPISLDGVMLTEADGLGYQH